MVEGWLYSLPASVIRTMAESRSSRDDTEYKISTRETNDGAAGEHDHLGDV